MLNNSLYIIFAFCLAAGLGAMIMPKILFISQKKKLFDLPNSRKVHDMPIPRLGGLSFFPEIIITCGFIVGLRFLLGLSIDSAGPQEATMCKYLMLIVGMTILYLIGICDDLVGLSYKPKFLAQLIAASLLAASGTWLNTLNGLFGIYDIPAYVGMPITIFLVIYITNAINLIDGIDGLASGLCCIALGILTIINVYYQQYYLALLGASTFGVIVPFWVYNVFGNAKHGHKIFMGDTGSLTLGLVLGFLAINMSQNMTGRPNDVNHTMIIVFSTLIVPVFDVVRVVFRRVINKKNPFLPDKNHFHHKLLRTGMRARWVMITILLFSGFFIIINTLMTKNININIIVVIDIAVWVLFHCIVTHFCNKHKREKEAKEKAVTMS